MESSSASMKGQSLALSMGGQSVSGLEIPLGCWWALTLG